MTPVDWNCKAILLERRAGMMGRQIGIVLRVTLSIEAGAGIIGDRDSASIRIRRKAAPRVAA